MLAEAPVMVLLEVQPRVVMVVVVLKVQPELLISVVVAAVILETVVLEKLF